MGLFGRSREQKRKDFVKRAEDMAGSLQIELYRSSANVLAARVGAERAGRLAAAIANFVCRFGFISPDHANDGELMRSFEENRLHVFASLGDIFKTNATGVLILLGAAWNVPLDKFKDHIAQLAAEGFTKIGAETPDVRHELPEEALVYMFETAALGR
jgi:hypothetical protein